MPIVRLSHLEQFAAVNVLSDGGYFRGKLVIPGCAQVVLVFNLTDGKLGHCVMYGKFTGTFGVTQAQINSALTALTTGAQWSALAAFMPSTTALTAVQVRNVDVEDQPLLQSNNAGANGTSASPAIPDESALVIRFNTAFAGKSGHGRIYYPAWATNALGTGGAAAAAAVTALGNWADVSIGAAFAAMSLQHVVGLKQRVAYTGVDGTPHPARPARGEPVTARLVPNNTWDSQRKRGLR